MVVVLLVVVVVVAVVSGPSTARYLYSERKRAAAKILTDYNTLPASR